jgi:predicted metalloendopeptidase
MTSVPRPQDDFFLHVNQAWLNNPDNKIPDEYSQWGGFIKLHDEGLKNQISLVQELRNIENKNEEETKISALWEASVARFESWRNGTATLAPIITELETLDSFLRPCDIFEVENDLVVRLARYLHYSRVTGITNVFHFGKGSDLTNTNNVVLYLSSDGLSLPGREYYTEEVFKEKRELFKGHLQNVAEIVNQQKNSGGQALLDEDFAENVFAFENELAKYSMKKDQERKYDEYYTNTNLADLYLKINELRSLPEKQENYEEGERHFVLDEAKLKTAEVFFEEVYRLFNFREALKQNLEAEFIAKGVENLPHPEHVTAFDGDAIRRIFGMISDPNNFKKYRSFLQYQAIHTFATVSTKPVDEEFFDFYSRKLRGQAEQKPEDKRSILSVNGYAGEMLGKVFVSRYFPEIYKISTRSMVQKILDVLQESITSNDWLTTETKSKAIGKLKKFQVKIGYPDVWKDYSEFDVKPGDSISEIFKQKQKWELKVRFYEKLNSVLDRKEWLMTPQTVNAYFMPTQNEIVFPAAILQPPFFCKVPEDIDFDFTEELKMISELTGSETYDFTESSNFGAIGAVIAHEITHGYDDKGRKFDGDGNLSEWWTEEDVKLFTAKTEIMAEQAKLYVFKDPDGDAEHKMNAELTMGENLADIGGVSLALQALNLSLKNKNASEDEIRINQRVFFKSFANIWKENRKKDTAIKALTTDPHAPPDFRANLVNNIDEFYKVFGVAEGDKMYLAPEARLRMW